MGNLRDKRIGEINYNAQGLLMKIIKYNTNKDIDIEFEDGYISKNKKYTSFKDGKIKNPNYKSVLFVDRTGEINTNFQGLEMEIIYYKDTSNLDIKFKDGTIVKNRTYQQFKNGSIKNKNFNHIKSKYLNMIKNNNQGLLMKIIRCENANNIDVEFEDGYVSKNKRYKEFKNGSIKNPYYPDVYNIGYIGEGKYKSKENNKITKEYKHWIHMLQRCYDNKFQEKHPTYNGCSVCEEWLNFQNFAEWFNKNYYEIDNETMCLDKDILSDKTNKIYSPNTCLIVPKRINSLFIKCNENILNNNNEYLVKKKIKIKNITENYKNKIPEKVYNALCNWEI